MRISDWSSDVCSSDLSAPTRAASGSFQHPTQRPPYYPFCPYLRYRTTATMLFPATVGQPVCGGDRRERVMSIELTVLAWGCVLGVVQKYVAAELEGRQYGMKSIGRESCRERVWQYV